MSPHRPPDAEPHRRPAAATPRRATRATVDPDDRRLLWQRRLRAYVAGEPDGHDPHPRER
jgi:hypothetical protein